MPSEVFSFVICRKQSHSLVHQYHTDTHTIGILPDTTPDREVCHFLKRCVFLNICLKYRYNWVRTCHVLRQSLTLAIQPDL